MAPIAMAIPPSAPSAGREDRTRTLRYRRRLGVLLYLDLAFHERQSAGRMNSLADLQEAITEGAVKRIRPKFMTVATMFVGLAPIMWSAGAGSDVMKRIAAPMIGGIFTSFLLELVVYPALYEVWRWHSVRRQVA